jgi:hypothetical protein
MNKKTGAGGEIYDDNYMNQPLGKLYSEDIVDKMTQMLADELTKSIDSQIINELFSKKNKRKIKIENLLKSFV